MTRKKYSRRTSLKTLLKKLDITLPEELLDKERKLEINRNLETRGVVIVDPENTYIESTVKIKRDAVILPGNFIFGNTVIEQDTVVELSVIIDSFVGKNCKIGPFGHILNSKVVNNVELGKAEVVRSEIGENTVAKHTSYIGDSKVGKRCNIGAGYGRPGMVVTCNYDGKEKHKTIIGDDVFVGSGSMIVAPVKIGDKSFIAANSTVTEDVPSGKRLGCLVIARGGKQINKPNRIKVTRKKNGRNNWEILKLKK